MDLKADRAESALLVQNAHLEMAADQGNTADALVTELRSLADWLKLEHVVIKKGNAFEKALAGLI